jgi:hypothetical protein
MECQFMERHFMEFWFMEMTLLAPVHGTDIVHGMLHSLKTNLSGASPACQVAHDRQG